LAVAHTETFSVSVSKCRDIYICWLCEGWNLKKSQLQQRWVLVGNWISQKLWNEFSKKRLLLQVLSFCSGVAEDSVLLGYDAVSWGNWVMTLYAHEKLTPDYRVMQCHISEQWKPETECSLWYL